LDGDTKRTIRNAVLLTAVLIIALPTLEATPLNLTTGYTRRLWRAQDGLPDQTVQAIAQTADGYLSIGTKGGLLRFDGERFVVFDHSNTPGLSESSINCLSVSRDGSLWQSSDWEVSVPRRRLRDHQSNHGLRSGD
jgi:ligand-binding sensor domain-containing protein